MSDGLAYLFSIALAVVFFYSAVTKIRDARPTARALERAGIPRASVIAKFVPAIEVIAAVELLTMPMVGGIISLVVLVVFTGFIMNLLVRKINVSCGCFGANATTPVSSFDIVRNVALALLACCALSVRTPHAFGLSEVIAVTMTMALGALLLTALRMRGELGQFFDNRLPGER